MQVNIAETDFKTLNFLGNISKEEIDNETMKNTFCFHSISHPHKTNLILQYLIVNNVKLVEWNFDQREP